MNAVAGAAAEGDRGITTVQESLYDTIERVKQYIFALPTSFNERLTEHASHAEHEDVLEVPDSGGAVDVIEVGSSHSSIPPLDPRIPHRLAQLNPPENFGAVVPKNIYRSAYPQPENYPFLKSLGLKTILTLVPEKISPEYKSFMEEHGIEHFQTVIPANKGVVCISACEMTRALEVVLDRRNHPMLIHCNKGKHRTGCVVGCFRRAQGEELEAVFDEYHTYANPKARLLDEAFIELFNENTVLWMARRYNWIPPVDPPSPAPTFDSTTLDVAMSDL